MTLDLTGNWNITSIIEAAPHVANHIAGKLGISSPSNLAGTEAQGLGNLATATVSVAKGTELSTSLG